MPDPRARPVAPPDPLAELNDHLGRFLRQADELLDEWTRFSAEVRARVAADTDRLADTVAATVDTSLDRAIATRLAALTAELDRLTAQARRTTVADRRTSRLTLAALAAALLSNILLVALFLRPPAAVRPPAVRGTAAPTPAENYTEPPPAVHGTVAVPDAGVDAAPVDAAPVDAAVAPDAAVKKVVKPPPRRRGK